MKIGDVVSYEHIPSRVTNGNKRTWDKTNVSKSEAVYIGYRYIFDGYMEIDREFENEYFVKSKTIRVWLVVQNERENPFYVFPTDE